MSKNEGKKFEDYFHKSIPEYVLCERLKDNAVGWSGGGNTRFASTNRCDFICYNDNTHVFYGLELKSTKEKSLTFWREDFVNADKKQSFMIRKCQILGLKEWAEHHIGVFGFILNFRNCDNRTYFVDISEFLKYTTTLSKKSINIDDIIKMNPIEIKSTKLRTNYRYDLETFFKNTKLEWKD